jgi:hypothetical protein
VHRPHFRGGQRFFIVCPRLLAPSPGVTNRIPILISLILRIRWGEGSVGRIRWVSQKKCPKNVPVGLSQLGSWVSQLGVPEKLSQKTRKHLGVPVFPISWESQGNTWGILGCPLEFSQGCGMRCMSHCTHCTIASSVSSGVFFGGVPRGVPWVSKGLFGCPKVCPI